MAATILAYRPGMKAGFYFDDLQNLVENSAFHWTRLSFANVHRVFTEAFMPTRLVTNLTFAINHLFGGLDPAGYHWTNLAIHLAVGAALGWVVLLLAAERTERRPAPDWAARSAVFAAALFLLHPLNIQAVTYVVQRMTSLATLFVLLSFGAYLRARRPRGTDGWRRPAAASLAAWIVALGCKEIAVALPLIILVYEGCFHAAFWRRQLRERWPPSVGAGLLVLVAVGVAAAIALQFATNLFRWNETLPGRDFTGAQRVMTELRVQFFYLGLLLWPAPSRLNLDHDVPVSLSLLDPWTTAAALAAWCALAVGAAWLGGRHPRYGFPLLAYAAYHLLESLPLNLELVFEHRMYLPMTMLAILAGTAIADVTTRRRAATIAAVLLCCTLGAATYRRNETWADPMRFHFDCAEKSPRKFRPQYNLGTELGVRGRHAEAEAALRRALALEPKSSLAHNQLGNVCLLTHRPDEALAHYQAAVESAPGNPEALYNLAMRYEARGDVRRAAEYYERFLAAAPPALDPQRREVAAKLNTWFPSRAVPGRP